VLSLLTLTLGLTALGVGSAQAEVGSHWNVAGKAVTSTLLPELQVKEIENKTETLLSKVLGTKVEKLCTTMALVGAKLESEGKISNAKVKFSGCILKLNGTVSPPCEPHTGSEKGVIVAEGKGLMILSGGAGIIRLEPAAGEKFVTVETSEECSIGSKIPLIGKLTLKDCKGAFSTEQVEHLVEEGPQTELWLISKTEEHKVTLDGSGIVILGWRALGIEMERYARLAHDASSVTGTPAAWAGR
jgi:hypothetical protein